VNSRSIEKREEVNGTDKGAAVSREECLNAKGFGMCEIGARDKGDQVL